MSWITTYADDDCELSADVIYCPPTDDVPYLPNGDPGYPGDPESVEIVKVIKVLEDGTEEEMDPADLSEREMACIEYEAGKDYEA